jgi:uncharacterized protein
MTYPEVLALAFLVTAATYSSVGFGGGSTYTALLLLWASPLETVPLISLACNICVVAIGAARFRAVGAVDLKRIWPLVVLSVPGAWIGAFLPLPVWMTIGALSLALAAASMVMLWPATHSGADHVDRSRGGLVPDLASGAVLGTLAGITGIGGGIYLSPLLHVRRWGDARLIAGTSTIFILLNSASGLVGSFSKLGFARAISILEGAGWLLGAVCLGSLAGSTLGSFRLKLSHLRAITGALTLYVAVRLGVQCWSLAGF